MTYPASMVRVCPSCDTTKFDERETLEPDYRCRVCQHEFNEPDERASKRGKCTEQTAVYADRDVHPERVREVLAVCVDNGMSYVRSKHVAKHLPDTSSLAVGKTMVLLEAEGVVENWRESNTILWRIHEDEL